MATVFLKGVTAVTVTESGEYNVNIEFIILGGATPSAGIGFIAPWGTDWRLKAYDAINDFMIGSGEVLDGVVYPDLTTV